jgi:hypothetical protein
MGFVCKVPRSPEEMHERFRLADEVRKQRRWLIYESITVEGDLVKVDLEKTLNNPPRHLRVAASVMGTRFDPQPDFYLPLRRGAGTVARGIVARIKAAWDSGGVPSVAQLRELFLLIDPAMCVGVVP